MMVDKWISEDWARQHALCRGRRLMMPGPAHHQGSRSLAEYKETWVSSLISSFFLKLYFEFLLMILLISWQSESHSGQSCNDFTAYAMSHMGRVTSDVAYNPAAPPEAYTNPASRCASLRTRRWEGRSTGRLGIRRPRHSLEKPS